MSIYDKTLITYFCSLISPLVQQLQIAADAFPQIRENFGPYFKHKFTSNWSVSGHQDHIHFSVNGQ